MSRYPTTPMCDGALLEAFEPTARPTDVFMSAAAKCGQTWTLALLHHLRTRGRDPHFGGVGAMGVTPWLEFPRDPKGQPHDRGERLAFLAGLPDPRVFKLHVTWEEIPRPPGSRAKVITASRDVRDVAYSMYAHLTGMNAEVAGFSLDQPFDAWFDGWVDKAFYFGIVRSFWERRDDPDLLWLRYEDMKADLAGEARRIVEFLGWDLQEDDIDRAVALSDLGAMQAAEKVMIPGGAFKEGHRFVREGASGKNRARLTASQEARLMDRARRELPPACFEHVMALGA